MPYSIKQMYLVFTSLFIFFANVMSAVQAMKPAAAMKKKENQVAMKATHTQDSILCYIALVLWC